MDCEDIYVNVELRKTEDTTGPQTQSRSQDERKDRKHRGLVLMTVCLGLICVLLLVLIIWQHISITAERESLFKSHKNTVQEFNQTISSLEDNYTDLMTEKDQLKSSFNSLNRKKLELERNVTSLSQELSKTINSLKDNYINLMSEKDQLKSSFNSLNRKKLELESNVTSLGEELKRELSKRGVFLISSELKSWSESRQYCRDHGGDLVIINTEEKQRLITSFKEKVWIGLTDTESEGKMKWVDNSALKQGFWLRGEPNDQGGSEDCIELMPENPVLNNWNDLPCSQKRKGICEK